jgi:hypothetical protein
MTIAMAIIIATLGLSWNIYSGLNEIAKAIRSKP